MHIAIILGITFLVILVVVRLLNFFSEQIKFITTGLDQKFNLSEIRTLWKLAKTCGIQEPLTLFYSVPTLSRCITNIIEDAEEKGIQDTPQVQDFLSRLYKYRTKIELDLSQKKGLDSTKGLDKGQKLRIIYPGKGVHESQILNNGRELIIKLPTQKGVIKIKGEEWVDQDISVYLWRKGDANYVFDSKVISTSVFNGQAALFITQSNQILRAQKRHSVRCACHVPAALYIIKEAIQNYSTVETAPGYKCILEDISEDGAMIRVGGKGTVNVQIKIQFELEGSFILMFGIIKAVEYNQEANQSRLHFECTHIEPAMKNFILSFVYKTLPDRQKEILEAISESENDGKEIEEQNKTADNSIKEEELIHVDESIQEEENISDEDLEIPDIDIQEN